MLSRSYSVNKKKTPLFTKLKNFFIQRIINNSKYSKWLILPGILILVTILIYFGADKQEASHHNVTNHYHHSKMMTFSSCNRQNLELICSGIEISQVKNILSKEKGIIEVSLNHVEFPNRKLKQNWLKQINIKIVILTFLNCGIVKIEDYAFSHAVFNSLEILNLFNINVINLNAQTFAGLTSLKELKIENSVKTFNGFNFLNPLHSNLLKFHYVSNVICEKLNIRNLLATSNPNKIETISLNGNNFENTLNNETFYNYDNLKNIKMTQNQINTIGPETFDSVVHTLEWLDLSRNALEYFPESIFSKLMQKKNFRLKIVENQLRCNCKLLDFINQYEKYRKQFVGELYCYKPSQLKNEGIDKVKDSICSDILLINCNGNCLNCLNNTKNSSLVLKKSSVLFDLIKNGSKTVQVEVKNLQKNLAIIWFNKISPDPKQRIIECGHLDRTPFYINQLKRNLSYTICIVLNNSKIISPFDCHPYNSNKGLEIETTVCSKQKSRDYLISFFVAIAIAPIMTATSVYLFIKLYPTYLENGSNIVIVKKKNRSESGIMIIPKRRSIKHSDLIKSTRNSVKFSHHQYIIPNSIEINHRPNSKVDFQTNKNSLPSLMCTINNTDEGKREANICLCYD